MISKECTAIKIDFLMFHEISVDAYYYSSTAKPWITMLINISLTIIYDNTLEEIVY